MTTQCPAGLRFVQRYLQKCRPVPKDTKRALSTGSKHPYALTIMTVLGAWTIVLLVSIVASAKPSERLVAVTLAA